MFDFLVRIWDALCSIVIKQKSEKQDEILFVSGKQERIVEQLERRVEHVQNRLDVTEKKLDDTEEKLALTSKESHACQAERIKDQLRIDVLELRHTKDALLIVDLQTRIIELEKLVKLLTRRQAVKKPKRRKPR